MYTRPDFIPNPKPEHSLPRNRDFIPGSIVDEIYAKQKNDFEPKAEVVDDIPQPADVQPSGFKCDSCGLIARTERGIRIHIAKAHGEENET